MRIVFNESMVAILVLGVCGLGQVACDQRDTSGECATFSNTLFASPTEVDSSVSWKEKVREYVNVHAADEDAYPVVIPNTIDIRAQLEAAGATNLYEFHSFDGVGATIKVGDLEKLFVIEGIVDVSLGAVGWPQGC